MSVPPIQLRYNGSTSLHFGNAQWSPGAMRSRCRARWRCRSKSSSKSSTSGIGLDDDPVDLLERLFLHRIEPVENIRPRFERDPTPIHVLDAFALPLDDVATIIRV